ncbi:uncharacterized protein RHIMIDRAFT_303172 [Rhizopus microsporus ATCC 52813]|uniref:Reverse transcriptase zinc-binding domain-containing protein n=1 Tax=Rhizopus microsporus ATCC 52813 TaxID=1340429 RepID=A0A2G4T499_RHIZD|nr:uncharacterized protein RHIMIDRAFT_303172 [Rhizopus microsporus ATCC 52813]PHZ15837.1 hypothetical protein RHIMIDRAFT_303172 [Rhizopus microsporus ATCC 52813]
MSQPTPISASVSMVLPLSEVINWPSEGHFLLKRSSYSNIQVQDAFIFDPQLQFIRRRLTAEKKRVVKRRRNRVVRLYQLLDSHSVCLSLSLSRLILPSQIGLHDGTLGPITIDDTILPLVTPLVDRQTQLIQPSHMRKLIHKASLSQAKEYSVALGNSIRFWKSFWRMDVPLPARNVWFRLIHGKLSATSNLHKIIPSFSSFCRLCNRGSPSETTCHFLIDCRKKYIAWKLIWAHFFPLSPWSRHALLQAILHLNFPQQSSVQSLDSSSIFGCSLLMIWKTHWRFIFDSTPFVPTLVLQEAIRVVQSLVPPRTDNLTSP